MYFEMKIYCSKMQYFSQTFMTIVETCKQYAFISICHIKIIMALSFPPLVIRSMSMDVHVKQAVLHVVTLKLRKIVRFELSHCQSAANKIHSVLVKIFSASNREVATPVITILHKLQMKRIIHSFPQLGWEQVNRLCRQYTRLFIRNLIKKELMCQHKLNTRENSFKIGQDKCGGDNIVSEGKAQLENQALIIMPKTLNIIPSMNVKIENMNADVEMDKLSVVSVTQKGSLPQTKTEYQNERVNLKAESNHSHVQQSPTTTVAVCERENDNHAVEQSERYGHFDFGDELNQIQHVFLVQKQIFGMVSWKPRFDGVVPEQSTLSVRCIRKYVPLELSEFYEVFLHKIERRKRFFKEF